MTTYFEYGVKLTDGQKSKLLSAINNRSPLTLRLKHSHLRGSDELMLTKRQINKIKKSMANGTGSDMKISKTQIRNSVKHGGSLFSSLLSLGSKVLPFAIKAVSKLAPALATGAATALGDLGIKKLFGKGITIPKKFFPFLPPIAKEFTKSQINEINKVFKTGGRLVIKPTQQQIEGDFLEHLHRLVFQWLLVCFQNFLDLVYRLIGDHLVTQEMFMFLHPHTVRGIRITLHPFWEIGKTQ